MEAALTLRSPTKQSPVKAPKPKNNQNTLMSWNTEAPIICLPFESTYKVARAMASRKIACALVQERHRIVGIFTAKDLAFKVVAKGLHPQLLKAKDIMTPNPVCASTEEPASLALNKMIHYKIRHLPLLDASGLCIGLLDITKCFQQTLSRLRKLAQTLQKLQEALAEVQQNIAGILQDPESKGQHAAMYYEAQDMVIQAQNSIADAYANKLAFGGEADFDGLLAAVGAPLLADVMAMPGHVPPLYVDANGTIRGASELMKKHGATAVLVRDALRAVVGILTTKDIVYRVLAEDEEPNFTMVTRVMTPSPEVALEDTGLVAAFELMYAGRFLNLPVTDDMGSVVGLVSVLQLTTMALQRLTSELGGSENALWDDLWADDDLRLETSLRLEYRPPVRLSASLVVRKPMSPVSRFEEEQVFDVMSEVLPDDLVLVASKMRPQGRVFKLKDVDDGRIYKISVSVARSRTLYDQVKLTIEEKLGTSVHLGYVDEDEDELGVENDDELQAAIDLSVAQKRTSIALLLSRAAPVGTVNEDFDKALEIVESPVSSDPIKAPPKPKEGILDLFLRPEIMISGVVLTLAIGVVLGGMLSKKR